jgi:hypothetical protein
MPSGIEEISLVYKVAGLLWEIGSSVRTSGLITFGKEECRLISSLTTLEITRDGNDQIAYFVQDRTVKILKESELPAFRYGTTGVDTLGRLLVNDVEVLSTILEQVNDVKVVGARQRIKYAKNEVLRCVLTGSSKNGFVEPKNEWFTTTVNFVTDSATILVIFPAGADPKQVTFSFRKIKDKPGTWRSMPKNKGEMRHFPGNRKAVAVTIRNPLQGDEYKIGWDWT